eukprot:gene4093-2940_t
MLSQVSTRDTRLPIQRGDRGPLGLFKLLPVRSTPPAMDTAGSQPPRISVSEYAKQADYRVMMQRFKLLNLVQQLAHQDVLEMIEAVGLDALTYKGTVDKWHVPGRQRGAQESMRATSPAAPRRGRGRGRGGGGGGGAPQWVSSRRGDSGMGAGGGGRVRRRVRGTAFRSEEERNAYFSRLANPVSRAKALDDESSPYRRGQDSGGRPRRSPPGESAAGHPIVHRRQISFEDERTLAGDGGSSRTLRGLAPKAKPMGATVDSDPSRVSCGRPAAASQRPPSTGRSTPGYPPVEGDPPTGSSGSAPPPLEGSGASASAPAVPPGPSGAGPELAPDGAAPPPQNAAEMMALVDAMLQAQEKVLHEVASDADLGGRLRPSSQTKPPTLVDAETTTARGRHAQTRETYLEDALLQDSDEDEEMDELLVLSRMDRRLTAMEGELSGVKAQESDEVDEPTPTTVRPTGPRRQRGEMPAAMRNRLLSARKEAFEYIAFNERQWNTSTVSQFTFAQRLTLVLAEDSFNEVLEEVLTIMDDYVEGLADHELQ